MDLPVVEGTDDGFPGWTLTRRGDQLTVRYRHSPVVRARLVFWDRDWQWRWTSVAERPYGFDFAVEDLGLSATVRVAPRPAGGLTLDVRLRARRALAGVVGGAFAFEIARPAGLLPAGAGATELLPGRRGFRVPVDPAGAALEVAADRSLARVTHEQRDGREEVRCFLVGSELPRGLARWRLTVRLPAGGRVQPPRSARLSSDRAGWAAAPILSEADAVDLSFLSADDRPAGRHGPARIRDGALVRGDGRPLRLWGTNLTAYALFGVEPDTARRQARRLAALGFNLVRLHHHDSHWVVPNVFEPGPSTRVLRPASLADLDRWIAALNEAGLYVWLDLHVGRRFGPRDGVPGHEEAVADPGSKGFAFVNRDMEARMHEFARAYLDRLPAIPGGRPAAARVLANPGLLGVLVVNEDDLNSHFGPRMYPGGAAPVHARLFQRAVEEVSRRLFPGAPPVRAQDTWAPGPGKLVLATIEAEFHARALAHLRALGLAGLVAVGNVWGEQPLHALPPLALGDLIDVHGYGAAGELERNPHFEPGFLDWIAAARVVGKPLMVSEWGVPLEHVDRFTAPIRVAAVAALQGWDAVLHYAYAQHDLGAPPDHPETWSAALDPALMAPMPAAALAFRRGDVAPARRRVVIQLDRAALYDRERSPRDSVALRTLTEQHQLALALPDLPELPWDGAGAARPGAQGDDRQSAAALERDFLPAGGTRVVSDTGELARDWALGVHVVDTPRTQAAAGWLGGQRIALADLQVRLDTPLATVALSSLDGEPIARSRKLLLTTVARVEPSPGGRLPMRAEPVRGALRLRVRAGLQVRGPVPGEGGAPGISAARDGEWLRLTLDGPAGQHHLLAP